MFLLIPKYPAFSRTLEVTALLCLLLGHVPPELLELLGRFCVAVLLPYLMQIWGLELCFSVGLLLFAQIIG